MSKKTVREFAISSSVWPIVEAWAQEADCQLVESSQSSQLYRWTTGGAFAPVMIKITHRPSNVRLEAWVQPGCLYQLLGFPFIPGEMGIESGGVRLSAIRGPARQAVNGLLNQLGQPPIK